MACWERFSKLLLLQTQLQKDTNLTRELADKMVNNEAVRDLHRCRLQECCASRGHGVLVCADRQPHERNQFHCSFLRKNGVAQ